MHIPDVSVVIPTYNRAPLLPEALASALAQTHTDLEILIVDDGSTDDTASVVAPFLSDKRVRLIRQANAGVSAARNTGIREATGRFVAFLDSDDLWAPDHVARLRAMLEQCPEAVIAFSHFRFVGDGDADTQASAFSASLRRVLESGFDARGESVWLSRPSWRRALFEVGFPFRIQGTLVRRAFLRDHALWFDEEVRFTEEAQFVIELAAHGRGAFLEAPTLHVRRHAGNTGDTVYGDTIITSYERRVRRCRARVGGTLRPDERIAYRRMLGLMQARVMHARAARAGVATRCAEGLRLLRVEPTLRNLRFAASVVLSPGRPFPG